MILSLLGNDTICLNEITDFDTLLEIEKEFDSVIIPFDLATAKRTIEIANNPELFNINNDLFIFNCLDYLGYNKMDNLLIILKNDFMANLS